jgi:hypothetical protein
VNLWDEPTGDFEDRFWSKVNADGVCWEWTAARNNTGYGTFNVGGKKTRTVTAHRYAYETLVGLVPEEYDLDHLCRNRACVNPDHMEPVSHKVNVLRGVSFSAINATKTHCPQGHAYTPENTRTERYGGRRCRTCERGKKRSAA